MSSIEESKTLRKRAEIFLEHAQEALEREQYDFACFSAEQAAQLYLKALALVFLGEIPRIHRVRELLSVLADTMSGARDAIKRFIKQNREALRVLEESYIAARYLPSTYSREEADAAVDLVKKVFRFCDTILKQRR